MDHWKFNFILVVLTAFLIGGVSISPAEARNQPSINGSAGRLAAENGAAAAINRKIADHLYQQSIRDESAAWNSFPPNEALLSRALQLSKDAKAADDQAKELARSSLHSAQIGSDAANEFSLEMYGAPGEESLKELANNSSPYMPQVQSTMSDYGMELDKDKMGLKTPLGSFSTGISDSILETGARAVAKMFGYSADAVSSGIQQAKDFRSHLNQLAEIEMAEQRQKIAEAGQKIEAESGSSTSDDVQSGENSQMVGSEEFSDLPSGEASGTEEQAAASVSTATTADNAQYSPEDPQYDRRIAEFQAQLDALHNRFTLPVAKEVRPEIAAKGENIFNLIRVRYQNLRSLNAFIEDIDLVPANARPAQRVGQK